MLSPHSYDYQWFMDQRAVFDRTGNWSGAFDAQDLSVFYFWVMSFHKWRALRDCTNWFPLNAPCFMSKKSDAPCVGTCTSPCSTEEWKLTAQAGPACVILPRKYKNIVCRLPVSNHRSLRNCSEIDNISWAGSSTSGDHFRAFRPDRRSSGQKQKAPLWFYVWMIHGDLRRQLCECQRWWFFL